MKESDREAKKKLKGGSGPASSDDGGEAYAEEDLISAINHPLRRQILRLMQSTKEPLSPHLIERELAMGGMLSQVSYHVTALSGYRVITLAGQRQVRGALEHFYVSEVSDVEWLQGLLSRTRKSDEAALSPKRPRRK